MNNQIKTRPAYHPVLFALLKFRAIRITTLARETNLSRPYVMKILLDPRVANGYDRQAFANALHVTTRFLDGVITGNIPEDTKHFQELFILQQNLKAEAEQNS